MKICFPWCREFSEAWSSESLSRMPNRPRGRSTLVADIGGTNTRLALASDGGLEINSIQKYRNQEFSSFNDALERYLDSAPFAEVTAICIAVAGPVRDGFASLTNCDWHISANAISEFTSVSSVFVINDMQALGHSLERICSSKTYDVISKKSESVSTTKLVVNIGTGFNSAMVLNTANGPLVAPSESGHSSLPVATERQFELLKALRQDSGFTSVECVLSGRGIEALHSWLNAQRAGDFKVASNDAITANFGRDAAFDDTGRLFAEILGSVAGNLALVHLPFGGIYLAGSVAKATARVLNAFGFREAFLNKGRFSKFMEEFSVSVIMDDDAPLRGCADYANSNSV